MKTVGEILTLSCDFLKKKNILSARLSAEELLASILRCTRMDLYLRFDQPLDFDEIETMRGLIRRRALHEPVEYILGKTTFFGAELEVDGRVLIPRPETEILLDLSIQHYPKLFEGPREVLDLCTGSGCIAIALKKKFPKISLTASDLSQEALQLAQKNALANGVEIAFVHADLFEGLESKKFDILFCNPPYISKKEMHELDPDVKHYEPTLALFGGEDGGDYYRRIASGIKRFLNPKAKLFFEIGFAQAELVKALFNEPCYPVKTVLQDWSGKDRFFFLEFE